MKSTQIINMCFDTQKKPIKQGVGFYEKSWEGLFGTYMALDITCIFSTVSSMKLSLAQSLDDPAIKSKFEPWLWEKVQKLEANGTSRFITIGLGINCTSYEHNVTSSYSFRTQVATILAQEHNATILYIGKVLSFIDIKIRVPEIKEIAKYEFVDRSDGEAKITPDLDVSTTVIRSSIVVNEVGYNGSNVRVAVLDSGVNASHPDFTGKNILWRDFVNGRPTPYDDLGHGTHCAGIIAGTGQASNGIYRGVAPGITALVIGKMLPGNETIARQALDWAVSNSSQVISCSWSVYRAGGCDGNCLLCDKVDECVRKGVVVVKSAGNAGPAPQSIGCPGNAFHVITVGAINEHNTQSIDDDTILPASSRGPTNPTQEYPNGRIKPEVVAPGGNIMSPDISGGYTNFGMTSAAAPHVAGVAALLLQAHPDWTPSIVKSVIMGTARLNDNLQDLTENDRGKGIVDAERALIRPIDIPTDDADGKSESGEGIYVAQANFNGTYRVWAETTESSVPISWANAFLYKSYTPEQDMVNPTFYFRFHDIGFLHLEGIGIGRLWANLTLWDGENKLFSYKDIIHFEFGAGNYTTDCFHTMSYQYEDVLFAGHTYDIEYGFRTYTGINVDNTVNFTVQALSLRVISVLGPGNPSFEQRLQLAPGVYGVPYWSINNEGWRNVRGDLDGDGDCDGYDLRIFSKIYQGEYDWKADFDGDGDVDGYDLQIFVESFNNDVPCYLDGAYSWYTSGGGDYAITQWLCDFDVNSLKGKQVTFTFWFRPDSDFPDWQQNYAQAEILYVYDGNEGSEQSDPIYPTVENWYSVSVTATLPDNTAAIQVIIRGGPNFHAWIDNTTLPILP